LIALLKLLAVLAVVVFLIHRKWNLGLILGLAAALMGLLFARPLRDLGLDTLIAVADPLTLRLAGIVVLILVLSEILRQTARLDGMVHALEQLVPDTRIVLAIVPAFIGLLPMVGGAMFSAPMVDHIAERMGADAGRRTFVNYWFRHIWEYIFPLYPSFLLGAALVGLSHRQAMALLWPLPFASAVGGVLFGLLGLKPARRAGERGGAPTALREMALSVWPIGLVLLLALAVGMDLVISLILTVALLALTSRVGPRRFWDILRRRVRWETVIVIFGAMVFRRVLEETGAVTATSQALVQMRVPAAVVVFLVPFIAGLLSGLAAAAFAIGFPIVLPLMGNSPVDLGLVAWAWAGGMLGVMTSPLHMCLALTRVYFQAGWGAVYRRILPAALLTGTVAVLLLVVL